MLRTPLLCGIMVAQALGGSWVTQATGSGTTIPDPLASERQERAERLRPLLPTIATRDAQAQKAFAAYLTKRAAYRQQCRQDLREANRDTKLDVLLRCERGELTLEREWLLHQRDQVRALTEATATTRTAATQATDALVAAINTIVTAIDSKVYASADVLMDSRLKLAQKYRTPLQDALLRLRADRALSWTALLLDDAAADGAQDAPAVPCLQTEEGALRALLSAPAVDGDSLTTHLRALAACVQPHTEQTSSAK